MSGTDDEDFKRALTLHERGLDDEAKTAYLAVLARDPTHHGALTNLGTLLFNGGYRTAARTAYEQAARNHPRSAMARVNYGNALYAEDHLYQARVEFEAALQVEPECAGAHQGLAYVFDKLGDARAARYHRDLGYRGRSTAVVPYRGEGRAVAVLLLVSAIGGNVAAEAFLDDRTYFTTKLFAEYADDAAPLPFHSFVFNAIGDAELCGDALAGAARAVARTRAPVINAPSAVAATSRESNARRLAGIPGVRTPRTQAFDGEALLRPEGPQLLAAAGFGFPLLLRSPGYHTGEHFARVDSPEALAEIAASLPGERLLAIEELDARGADGLFRKYRTMFVDGELYPLHLAIGEAWKLHYFTGGAERHPLRREEEERFLNDPEAALGCDAVAALHAIAATLALDYGGIDFAIGRDGEMLLFEANAAMRVPVPSTLLGYRRAPAERIFDAVARMLKARAEI